MKNLIYLILLLPFVSLGQVSDVSGLSGANQIKNETVPGANTANRVGTAFVNLWNSKGNKQEANTWTGLQTFSAGSVNTGFRFGTKSSSDPSSSLSGEAYFNTTSNQFRGYDGTSFRYFTLHDGINDTRVQFGSSNRLTDDADLTFTGGNTLNATNISTSGTITAGTLSLTTLSGSVVVPVVNGGTNFSSYTIGDLIQASGTGTLSKLNSVATGNALISGGIGTVSSWGKIGLSTHVSGDLPFANLTQIAGLSVLGVAGASTADVAAITAGSDFNILRRSGSAVAFGSVDLSQSGAVGSSVLGVANGGTNFSSFTVGDLLQASASGVLSKLNAVATGNVLLSGGVATISAWGKVGLTTHVSGTLGVGNGGTGLASFTVGDLMYADGTTSINKLADIATGNVLITGGVGAAPSYGKVGLTTHVSGILPVANGGSGSSTWPGYLLASGGTLTGPNVFTGTTTNNFTFVVSDIGTSAGTGGRFSFQNNTDAADGAQQFSPSIRLRGEGWKTDATAGSQTVDFYIQTQPVQGTSAPTGLLQFGSSVNGASVGNKMFYSTAGVLTVPGNIIDNSLTATQLVFAGSSKELVGDTDLTFSGDRLTATKFSTTGIDDTNGNELVKYTTTSSAVNEFTMANAATGNAPTLSTTGSNTDINIKLDPKGAGTIDASTSKIVNVSDPTNAQDAATKAYVDALTVSSGDFDPSVNIGSWVNIASGTAYSTSYFTVQDMVSFCGYYEITPSAGSTLTSFEFNAIPVASTLTTTDVGTVNIRTTVPSFIAGFIEPTAGNKFKFSFTSANTSLHKINYCITYGVR